jgi:hypothetical protein
MIDEVLRFLARSNDIAEFTSKSAANVKTSAEVMKRVLGKRPAT